ncbi:MAG: hypothetical protein AAB787_03125 [Patescibacteria group bacterium]
MIKKLISFSFLTTTLLLGSFFLGDTSKTRAIEEAEAQVFCGFNEKLAELIKVQTDKEADSLQKIKNELVVRKELLNLIIDCSVKEAELLKTKLESVKIDDKEVAEVKEKTLSEIDRAIDYYEDQTLGIKDLGLQGSKLLAKKILDWRSSNYSVLVGQTVNIITWNNAEDFLSVADQRFLDVSLGVSGIKEESEEVSKVLDEAKESLENARILIASSKKSILEFAPNADTIEDVKKALEELASAYKSFFEMGQVIKDETLKKIE